jgi:methylmalonyl-CoA mutase
MSGRAESKPMNLSTPLRVTKKKLLMQKLFTEFTPNTAAQWKEQLVKDLKGVDFDQLVWHTNNGFDVNPFYTGEDLQQEKKPLFSHSDWNIGTFITVEDEKKANAVALEALNGGVSCLGFCLNGDKNLSVLLKDVLIEHIAVQFVLNNHIDTFEKQLTTIINDRGLNIHALNIAVNYDVLAHVAEHGNWLANRESDFADFLKVCNLPFNAHKLLVDASLYQNAGANQVTELALTLSHYNEYLNHLANTTFDLVKLKRGVQVNVSIGSDFFGEIAKLRALRKLVALVNNVYQIDAHLFISCNTSHLTLASKDAYTNLLRSTTQAMSAVIGGCSALYVAQFDELLDSENKNLSVRMARNQQLILKEESYLDKASDIGAGSYYIETLTEELAEKAFELFKDWEAQGGFIACLEKGLIQAEVDKQAAMLKEKTASGELVIIGVNKYINAGEKMSALKHIEENSAKTIIKPIKAIRLAEKFKTEQAPVK